MLPDLLIKEAQNRIADWWNQLNPQHRNMALMGGGGALLGGTIGAMSEKRKVRNALLAAMMAGGVGAGAGYMLPKDIGSYFSPAAGEEPGGAAAGASSGGGQPEPEVTSGAPKSISATAAGLASFGAGGASAFAANKALQHGAGLPRVGKTLSNPLMRGVGVAAAGLGAGSLAGMQTYDRLREPTTTLTPLNIRGR